MYSRVSLVILSISLIELDTLSTDRLGFLQYETRLLYIRSSLIGPLA